MGCTSIVYCNNKKEGGLKDVAVVTCNLIGWLYCLKSGTVPDLPEEVTNELWYSLFVV